MQVTINVDTEEDAAKVRSMTLALGYSIQPDPNREHATARVVAKTLHATLTDGDIEQDPGHTIFVLKMPPSYADGRTIGSEWDLCSPGFARGVGAALLEAGIGRSGGLGVSQLAGQRNAYRHALNRIRHELGFESERSDSSDRAGVETSIDEVVEAVRVAVEKAARYESYAADRGRFLTGVLQTRTTGDVRAVVERHRENIRQRADFLADEKSDVSDETREPSA
jgi:hypothetical protein